MGVGGKEIGFNFFDLGVGGKEFVVFNVCKWIISIVYVRGFLLFFSGYISMCVCKVKCVVFWGINLESICKEWVIVMVMF